MEAGSRDLWFFGPGRDLLFGCGLVYALVFAMLCLASSEIQAFAPAGLLPLLILFTGIPHYGATLLRVYDRREDRRAYALFAVFATAFVWALFAVGVYNDFVGSLILTLYLTWSPWHYTGQNYGIAMMFLGRREVRVDPLTKRFIYASFVASYVLTLLALHSVGNSSSYAPLTYEGTVYSFLPLGFSAGVGSALTFGVACTYLAFLALAGVRLLRVASARRLAPVAALALTQALWFSAPVAARHLSLLDGVPPLSLVNVAYAFLWIGIGHSVQYLWVTSYFASRRDGFTGHTRHYAKALLSGAAIWVVPALVLAPAVLGRIPYDAGLAVMVASVVNLHHFILDGAIWKLRDGRIARILLRGAQENSRADAEPTRHWLRPAIWLAGGVSVLLFAFGTIETEFGGRQAAASGDAARVDRATERLRLIGWDSSQLRVNAAILHAREGHLEEALAQAEAARALYPSDEVWRTLGYVNQRMNRTQEAIAAYRQALIARPGWADVENNLAWLLATREGTPEDAAEAIRLAQSVSLQFDNDNPNALDTLAVAYASSGHFDKARRTAKRALALARARGDENLAADIAGRLALYRGARPYREH